MIVHRATCPSITLRQLRLELESHNRPMRVMALVMEILQYWPEDIPIPLEVAKAWLDARAAAEKVH
jgi:hypothetical protein